MKSRFPLYMLLFRLLDPGSYRGLCSMKRFDRLGLTGNMQTISVEILHDCENTKGLDVPLEIIGKDRKRKPFL